MNTIDRTETFSFHFTDKEVWDKFFNEYFRNEKDGMRALSGARGNEIIKFEKFQDFVYEFMTEFKLDDFSKFVAKTPKQEELLNKMTKFIFVNEIIG